MARSHRQDSSCAGCFPRSGPSRYGAVMASKRYAVLALGASGDPFAAKTMHGVIRYAPAPTVVIVDPTAPGTAVAGIPVVGSVEDARAYSPTTAIVGV